MPKSPTIPTQCPSPQWARGLLRWKPRHSCRGGRPQPQSHLAWLQLASVSNRVPNFMKPESPQNQCTRYPPHRATEALASLTPVRGSRCPSTSPRRNSLLDNVLQAVCGSWFKCWVWAYLQGADNSSRSISSNLSLVEVCVHILTEALTRPSLCAGCARKRRGLVPLLSQCL